MWLKLENLSSSLKLLRMGYFSRSLMPSKFT